MGRGTANTGWYFHTGFNLIAASLIGGVVYSYYGGTVFYPLFIAMIFGTLFMSPDIDSNRSYTYRMWTPFFRWYWYPYTIVMSHSGRSYPPLEVKRGIGHNLFLGTAIRLIYASPLFYLVNELANYISLNSLHYIDINWKLIIAGIWIADCLHILVDMLFHRN